MAMKKIFTPQDASPFFKWNFGASGFVFLVTYLDRVTNPTIKWDEALVVAGKFALTTFILIGLAYAAVVYIMVYVQNRKIN